MKKTNILFYPLAISNRKGANQINDRSYLERPNYLLLGLFQSLCGTVPTSKSGFIYKTRSVELLRKQILNQKIDKKLIALFHNTTINPKVPQRVVKFDRSNDSNTPLPKDKNTFVTNATASKTMSTFKLGGAPSPSPSPSPSEGELRNQQTTQVSGSKIGKFKQKTVNITSNLNREDLHNKTSGSGLNFNPVRVNSLQKKALFIELKKLNLHYKLLLTLNKRVENFPHDKINDKLINSSVGQANQNIVYNFASSLSANKSGLSDRRFNNNHIKSLGTNIAQSINKAVANVKNNIKQENVILNQLFKYPDLQPPALGAKQALPSCASPSEEEKGSLLREGGAPLLCLRPCAVACSPKGKGPFFEEELGEALQKKNLNYLTDSGAGGLQRTTKISVINNVGKILTSFFKSISTLISKPQFINKHNKLTIRIFFYQNNLLKDSLFSNNKSNFIYNLFNGTASAKAQYNSPKNQNSGSSSAILKNLLGVNKWNKIFNSFAPSPPFFSFEEGAGVRKLLQRGPLSCASPSEKEGPSSSGGEEGALPLRRAGINFVPDLTQSIQSVSEQQKSFNNLELASITRKVWINYIKILFYTKISSGKLRNKSNKSINYYPKSERSENITRYDNPFNANTIATSGLKKKKKSDLLNLKGKGIIKIKKYKQLLTKLIIFTNAESINKKRIRITKNFYNKSLLVKLANKLKFTGTANKTGEVNEYFFKLNWLLKKNQFNLMNLRPLMNRTINTKIDLLNATVKNRLKKLILPYDITGRGKLINPIGLGKNKLDKLTGGTYNLNKLDIDNQENLRSSQLELVNNNVNNLIGRSDSNFTRTRYEEEFKLLNKVLPGLSPVTSINSIIASKTILDNRSKNTPCSSSKKGPFGEIKRSILNIKLHKNLLALINMLTRQINQDLFFLMGTRSNVLNNAATRPLIFIFNQQVLLRRRACAVGGEPENFSFNKLGANLSNRNTNTNTNINTNTNTNTNTNINKVVYLLDSIIKLIKFNNNKFITIPVVNLEQKKIKIKESLKSYIFNNNSLVTQNRGKNILQINMNKFKVLGNLLANIFNKNINIELIKLHNVGLESSILSQILNKNSKFDKSSTLFKKMWRKIVINKTALILYKKQNKLLKSNKKAFPTFLNKNLAIPSSSKAARGRAPSPPQGLLLAQKPREEGFSSPPPLAEGRLAFTPPKEILSLSLGGANHRIRKGSRQIGTKHFKLIEGANNGGLESKYNINMSQLHDNIENVRLLAKNPFTLGKVTGLNVRIAGRLKNDRTVEKKTVKTAQAGTLSKNLSDVITKSSFTSKNKKGTYRIQIKMGHLKI